MRFLCCRHCTLGALPGIALTRCFRRGGPTPLAVNLRDAALPPSFHFIYFKWVNSQCQVLAPMSVQSLKKGINCIPNRGNIKWKNGCIAIKETIQKRAILLSAQFIKNNMYPTICFYIGIISSSRKACIQLCMNTLAGKYVPSWKYL